MPSKLKKITIESDRLLFDFSDNEDINGIIFRWKIKNIKSDVIEYVSPISKDDSTTDVIKYEIKDNNLILSSKDGKRITHFKRG